MADKQAYKEGWTRDFDISATYYKGGDVCSDFLSVDIATQHGSLSQRIDCNLEALYILSDQIADMQRVVDDAIEAILKKKAEVDNA